MEALITSFSDTIVISIPLSSSSGSDPLPAITAIHSALYGICGIYLAALAEKKPFRCGVDVGLGLELPTAVREVYGEALVKAYCLENNVALYPRVVIGDSLYDYLDSIQKLASNTAPTNNPASKMADHCKALITNDHDKQKILDVLGEAFHSTLDCYEKHLVEKAYEFVVQSHNDFTKQGDLDLAPRYETLRMYFEAKLPLWGIQPI